jgi:sugar O-acyltransferase (sialic acid O-acetyltransferase NeuD family)
MKQKIILIGGGGHALSCIEVINQNKNLDLIGFYDHDEKKKQILNYNNLFLTNSDIDSYQTETKYLIMGIGFINNAKARDKLINELNKKNFHFVELRSKSSIVSNYSNIGQSVQIFNNVIINAGSFIGDHSILNNNCLIEHNCYVGKNVHISTGAILNGDVNVNDNTFIGSGAIINNGIKIGKNCIIPSGSVIRKEVPDNSLYINDRQFKKL